MKDNFWRSKVAVARRYRIQTAILQYASAITGGINIGAAISLYKHQLVIPAGVFLFGFCVMVLIYIHCVKRIKFWRQYEYHARECAWQKDPTELLKHITALMDLIQSA